MAERNGRGRGDTSAERHRCRKYIHKCAQRRGMYGMNECGGHISYAGDKKACLCRWKRLDTGRASQTQDGANAAHCGAHTTERGVQRGLLSQWDRAAARAGVTRPATTLCGIHERSRCDSSTAATLVHLHQASFLLGHSAMSAPLLYNYRMKGRWVQGRESYACIRISPDATTCVESEGNAEGSLEQGRRQWEEGAAPGVHGCQRLRCWLGRLV